MNVLKSTSSRYAQNMMENIVWTSYLDKSYLSQVKVDMSLSFKRCRAKS